MSELQHTTMAGDPSTTSSMSSTHAIPVTKANGNRAVITSVLWLVVATGLSFPWLIERPAASKAGDAAKSVAWFVVLAFDLVLATMSVFSLWFKKSSLSIMLLVWGSACIFATFLIGSFAMLPAVATM